MATNVGSGSGSSSGGGGSDKIRLNYAQMQDMATQCTKVAQRLLQTVTLVQQVAAQMQGGALVGDAGDAFTSASPAALFPLSKESATNSPRSTATSWAPFRICRHRTRKQATGFN